MKGVLCGYITDKLKHIFHERARCLGYGHGIFGEKRHISSIGDPVGI
jgi:hypothetical protein